MATVKKQLASLHSYNMEALAYNLCYGALNDAATEGVDEKWYLFKDRNHTQKDAHVLPKPMFISDIFLTDPGNAQWLAYIASRTAEIYDVYPFDGYQIDQLGNRGQLYDYDGNGADLPTGFRSFIGAMKSAMPAKRLVMNAVSGYGQDAVVGSGKVDFLYNEVWGESPTFYSLKTIIDINNSLSGGALNTVLAAYMNYDLANNRGYFNTPGVILADAVIFALGGSHLELGEHMLGKEYFPNDNLQMGDDLRQAIVAYYDFLTAYQNLLRDGGTFNSVEMSNSDGRLNLVTWQPSMRGKVAMLPRRMDDKTQVVHLLNFTNADSDNWGDRLGAMPEPMRIVSPAFSLTAAGTVGRIWMASPDMDLGHPVEVAFTQIGSSVAFMLPSLKYWNMVVVEYV
jgi:dextranase